jgi:DnaJ homolog subfamily C member 3
LDENSFYGLLQQGKDQLDKELFEAAIDSFQKAADVGGQQKHSIVQPLMNKAQVALKRSKTKDYYKVLGVAHDADERQIKSAYRKLSKQYHPDKAIKLGVTKQDAEKKMASINEAYEVLSNSELRARFDRGDDPNDPSGQSGPFPGGSPFGGQPFFFQQGGFPGGGGGGSGAKFQFHFGGGGPF